MTRFDRLSGWILPALAGVIPLLFVPAWHDSFDLPRLVSASTTVLILTVAWLLAQMSSDQGRWQKTGVDVLVMVFIAVHILSALQSIAPSTSWRGIYRVYTFGVWPMGVAILLFVLSAQCAHPEWPKRLRLAVMLSGTLVGYYASIQVMGIEFLSSMPKVTDGRPWSSLGNPLYVGAVCMMALMVVVGEWLEGRRDRLLLSVCAVGQSLGLFFSLSRSAWAATTVTLLIWSILERRRFRRFWLLPAMLLIGLVLVPQTRSRFLTLTQSSEYSNAARLEGWRGAVQIWKRHPFLGSGPDTFFEAFRPYRTLAYLRSGGKDSTQAHAHNDLFQMAATVGTLGLLAYLGMGIQLFRLSSSSPERMALLALLIQNLFNFSSITTTVWAAMLAAVCLPKTPVQWRWRWYSRGALVLAGGGIGLAVLRGAWIPAYADSLFQEGLMWRQNQQPVRALVSFREAIRWCPETEMYQTELGNTASALAQTAAEGTLRHDLLQEAWTSAQSVTRRHPYNPDAWNNRGVVAMWRTQLGGEQTMPDAREAFERAIALDASFIDAWANLAKWHHLSGDIDGEKTVWRKVLEMDPEHPMARQVLHP